MEKEHQFLEFVVETPNGKKEVKLEQIFVPLEGSLGFYRLEILSKVRHVNSVRNLVQSREGKKFVHLGQILSKEDSILWGRLWSLLTLTAFSEQILAADIIEELCEEFVSEKRPGKWDEFYEKFKEPFFAFSEYFIEEHYRVRIAPSTRFFEAEKKPLKKRAESEKSERFRNQFLVLRDKY